MEIIQSIDQLLCSAFTKLHVLKWFVASGLQACAVLTELLQ